MLEYLTVIPNFLLKWVKKEFFVPNDWSVGVFLKIVIKKPNIGVFSSNNIRSDMVLYEDFVGQYA